MYMEDYISEISDTIAKNIEDRESLCAPILSWLKKDGLYEGKDLVWVASGSSYNGILGAKAFMDKHFGSTVRLISPYEFSYYEDIDPKKNIYIFVSQSGCSTNILDAMMRYKEMGGYCIAVVGRINTTIPKTADEAIEYGVGEETVGYVTKGVSCMSAYCMLLTAQVVQDRVGKDAADALIEDIKKAAANHHKVYEYAKRFYEENEKAMLSMDHVMLCAGGANIGCIREGGLKMAEMVHIQTTYYESEEWIHGPNLQVNPAYTLFFVDGGDEGGKRTRAIYEASKELTDKTYIIGSDIPGLNATSELASPLYLTAFFQYMACAVSRTLDIRDDLPLYPRFKTHVNNKTADFTMGDAF